MTTSFQTPMRATPSFILPQAVTFQGGNIAAQTPAITLSPTEQLLEQSIVGESFPPQIMGASIPQTTSSTNFGDNTLLLGGGDALQPASLLGMIVASLLQALGLGGLQSAGTVQTFNQPVQASAVALPANAAHVAVC
jgi:hypothetical protein